MATFTLDLEAADIDHEDDFLVAFASAPLSAGISAPSSSKFRFVGAAFFGALPIEAGPRYTTQFGVPQVGATIWVDLYAINQSSGIASPRVRQKVLVA